MKILIPIDAIPVTDVDYDLLSHFLSGLCGKGTFQFRPADPELIEQIVLRQKPHTVGHDEISARMLQLALPHVLLPLTHIINFSFEMGSVPVQWKSVAY